MIKARIHLLRVGYPWRDLPAVFGTWTSVDIRWRRWALSGFWARLLPILAKKACGKLHAVVEGKGRALCLVLTPGRRMNFGPLQNCLKICSIPSSSRTRLMIAAASPN